MGELLGPSQRLLVRPTDDRAELDVRALREDAGVLAPPPGSGADDGDAKWRGHSARVYQLTFWRRGSAPADLRQSGIDRGEVAALRGERSAGPLQHPVVLIVVRVGDRLEEAGVAPWAADILRRPGATSGHAPR